MTVGSLTTHTTAQSVVPLRHPFPRVLGVPNMRGYAGRLAPKHGRSLRRSPAASACVPWQQPGWERRAPATSIGRGGLTPGTPPKSSCASMRSATKSQHGGGCKALWIRLGVNAPQRVHVRRRAGWPGAPVQERPCAGHSTCVWSPRTKLTSPPCSSST